MPGPRVVLLDTCVLVNLLASGEIDDVLRATAHEVLICSAVEKECLYLRSDDPLAPAEAVRLDPLLRAKLLGVCQIESEEEESLYVNYASELDDGEAMSVALAQARGYALATDERKARRLFEEAVGKAGRLLSTSDLIRGWCEARKIPRARLKSTLLQIRTRARFFPAMDDDHYRWWCDACGLV